MQFFWQQNSNNQQIYTLFSIVKRISTIIKHRFYNAVDVSVGHSTPFVNKNTPINATQNLIGNITLKPTQITLDFVFSTIVAPSLLRASKMSFDEFILFGTPRHSLILNKLKCSNLNIQNSVLPLYTCSGIKYSTFSQACIRRSMNGKHNRTTVIHNPLILSVTDKTKGEF